MPYDAGAPVTSYQKEWRMEYLQSLKETRPRYIVVQKPLGSAGLERAVEIKSFIDRQYYPDTLLDSYEIYERRNQ